MRKKTCKKVPGTITGKYMENLKEASGFFVKSFALQLQFTIHIFFKTEVLQKVFDIRFSYKHCNFSHVCRATRQDGVENRDKVYCYLCSTESDL